MLAAFTEVGYEALKANGSFIFPGWAKFVVKKTLARKAGNMMILIRSTPNRNRHTESGIPSPRFGGPNWLRYPIEKESRFGTGCLAMGNVLHHVNIRIVGDNVPRIVSGRMTCDGYQTACSESFAGIFPAPSEQCPGSTISPFHHFQRNCTAVRSNPP